MRSNYLKTALKTAVFAVTLLLGASTSFGQVVNLTAGPTTTGLPDGQSVPMWGYSCSDAGTGGASCAASNPSAGGGWSPVVITTAPGKLTINLTNGLTFTSSGVKVPTSLVIVGQVGGGLGAPPTKVSEPYALRLDGQLANSWERAVHTATPGGRTRSVLRHTGRGWRRTCDTHLDRPQARHLPH